MSAPPRRSYSVRPIGYVRTAHTELERTPIQSLRNPLEKARLDVPGWPSADLGAIRGGWYQRTGATSRAGLLAGRRSLERAGMLEPTPEESMDMELSARNQLKGVIRGVKTGQVMAEITVDIEAGSVVAAITDSSRERLNLQDGDQVTVFVKSTEVMIGK